MSRRGALVVAALATAGALVALDGCGAILGIPSDLVKVDDDAQADSAGAQDSASGDVNAVGSDASDAGDASDPSEAGDAGNADAADVLDAAVDAGPPPCNLAADFTPPVLLASISTPSNEGSPQLSEDELTISFDAKRGDAGFDLYTATRASRELDGFGAATPLPGVNTNDQEYSPSLTTDGLTLFFERQTNANGISRIMKAQRATLAGAFDVGAPISNINTNNYTASPFVRGDGTSLWYVSVGPKPSIDVFLATFVATTGYTSSQVLSAAVNETQSHPVVSKDGLALYFSWTKPLSPGRTDANIWIATRSTPSGAFSVPVIVNNVNTTSSDMPGWISGDGCRLYLASDRPGGVGQQDIYVASRPR